MPDIPADASPGLDTACAAMAATPTRLRVLRAVMDHSQVTAQELMSQLHLSRTAVGYHLSALSRVGLIQQRHATHPRGAGPVIYWTADVEAIHAVRETLFNHLT